MPTVEPVGIALLGAGIFAQEEHLPAILATPSLVLKAVYSRSQKSAEALAAAAAASASASSAAAPLPYFDSPSGAPEKSLAALLARTDIFAVVVCLPIVAQPAIIKQALAAGKHVLSEKPIAKDMATAWELRNWYRKELLPGYEVNLKAGLLRPIWAVAENFRFWKSLVCAAEKIREMHEAGGRVTTFRLEMYTHVKAENKYFNTEWRKTPEYQGGFLLDGGVHAIAGLRMLLGAGFQTIERVSAFSALLEARLPPIDTVHGVAATGKGVTGTLGLSFGTEFKAGMAIEVVTTEGRVLWTPREVRVTRRGVEGEETDSITFPETDSGVPAEMQAFADTVTSHNVDMRQVPEAALHDLELLESLFESGERGGVVVEVRHGREKGSY